MTAAAATGDRCGGSVQEKACALDDCSELVATHKGGGSRKRFCSGRCRRIAERRRYRARHTELTVCKRRGCGTVFERFATSAERKQVYCTPECQALARSVEYAGRPDILAGVARARAVAREAALDMNALRRDTPADMN